MIKFIYAVFFLFLSGPAATEVSFARLIKEGSFAKDRFFGGRTRSFFGMTPSFLVLGVVDVVFNSNCLWAVCAESHRAPGVGAIAQFCLVIWGRLHEDYG